MEYFKSFSQQHLVEAILSTKKELFLCMPSIHKEVANAILQLHKTNGVGIHLLIDFDAQTFRQGYGDCSSIELLNKNNVEIGNLIDNRISFIIIDQKGYFLFIESRSLIPADKSTVNAISIDPVSIVRLKKFFFNGNIDIDFEDALTNAIIEESKQLEKANELLGSQIAPVENLTENRIEAVSEALKKNPPLNPDYKRIVEFYSNKFQYVKLKFEGSNIQHKKIEIPSKILPIADTNLKKMLETKLNLFGPDNQKAFKALIQFKEDVNAFRESYLKKVKSREESILDKSNKKAFVDALEALSNSIENIKQESEKEMNQLIIQTKENLLTMLYDFFVANPDALFEKKQSAYDIEYVKVIAKDKSQEVVYKIKWPDVSKLVEDFKIDVQFSDITYEDLRNTKFIKELKEIGLIDKADESQLAEFGKGIEVK